MLSIAVTVLNDVLDEVLSQTNFFHRTCLRVIYTMYAHTCTLYMADSVYWSDEDKQVPTAA
jgi:hypothetical protein